MSPKRSPLNARLPHRVTMKHGAFYYLKPITRDGRNTTQWIRLGKTEAEMHRRMAELRDEGAGLMGAIIERYRAEVLSRKANNTRKAQDKQLDRLKKTFGHMRPRDLRPVHIARYHDLVGQNAPFQANRELALMTHVCKYAVRWGALEDNPCREVQRFPENARHRYVTHDEYVAVRDRAPLYLQILMDLSYVTGQRRVDLLSLKMSQLLEDGILIQQSKTGTRLLIEWTADLRAVVRRAMKDLPDDGIRSMYLVCNRRGGRITDAACTSAWTRLMDRCIAEGVIAEKFQYRDIRGKAGSDSDGEHLGHRSKAILDRHYKRKPKQVKPTQ